MEPPARACSCGSPASDSEVEAAGSPRSPPKPERSRKRPAGLDRAPPDSPPSPRGGKRPRKGEGGDVPPSDGDRLFAQKVRFWPPPKMGGEGGFSPLNNLGLPQFPHLKRVVGDEQDLGAESGV